MIEERRKRQLLASKNLIDILLNQKPRNDGSPATENKVDEEQYAFFIQTFNRNGFDFYIERTDLKFDYKADYLGGGGYGEVFKAHWMGAEVAVKRFGRKCTQRKSITDFIKEIEIVNQVRHPNIVQYLGISFDDQAHYFMVTEYASRGSIFDLVHTGVKNQIGDARIFQIIQELASALQYLHSKGILHCDLKSQNILLTSEWSVKICDFGLARYQRKFVRENYG
jgi:serine/threonine-protein kinase CTR1